MALSPEASSLRARIGGRKRQNPNADVTDDQRELKTIRLEEHIHDVLSTAPMPTPDQIARLRALLRPSK